MHIKELHRRSIRLKGYDYTLPGYYAVTICTWRKECILGECHDGVVRMSHTGEIASPCISEITMVHPGAVVNAFVIMPNHIHMVIQLIANTDSCMTAACTELARQKPTSLPGIIQTLKATAARRVNSSLDIPGSGNTIWQRNYYEHIIRNERELFAIRAYIRNNPANWTYDEENPDCVTIE